MPDRYVPRIFLFPLLLAFLGLFIATLWASRGAAATITLVVPDEPVPADETVEVDIWISAADNLGAFEVILEYDRSLVEIVDISYGDFLGPAEGCDPEFDRCPSYLSVLDEDGLTSVAAFTYGNGGGKSGDGRLATLHLQPTGIRGVANLHFNDLILLDVGANELPSSSQDAALTIQVTEFIYLPLVSH